MAEVDAGQMSCPFCSKAFKSVGKHLPRCRERDGRDYKQFLASSKRNGGSKVDIREVNVLCGDEHRCRRLSIILYSVA